MGSALASALWNIAVLLAAVSTSAGDSERRETQGTAGVGQAGLLATPQWAFAAACPFERMGVPFGSVAWSGPVPLACDMDSASIAAKQTMTATPKNSRLPIVPLPFN